LTDRAARRLLAENLGGSMRKAMIAVAGWATLGLGVLAPATAGAWSDQGHMATGDIAYDTLRAEHPASIAVIVAIMRSHPNAAAFDRQLVGLTGQARERRLLALMARWPDDARGGPYDRPDWHYAVKVVSPWRFVMPLSFGKAPSAFAENLAVARDPKAPAAQRAVALCWVLHIGGDMHQPLHAGHWMSWRFLKTDRAGTLAWVRRDAGGKPVDLHEVWDSAADRPAPRELGAELIARDAEAAHPRASQARSGPDAQAALRAWTRESWILAKDVAYRNGDGVLRTGRSPGAAPVLTKAYGVKTRDVAQARIAAAGYRLGRLLATVS
jgi:hypothetical protein